MFTDPQSITVSGSAKSMPRVEISGRKAIYRKDDSSYQMTISHANASGSRVRSMVRIDHRAIVADPLTSVNDYEDLAVYLVIDRPEVGFSATQIDALIVAFKAWLTTAAVTQLVGQES